MKFQIIAPLSLIGLISFANSQEECSYNLSSGECHNSRTPETDTCLEKVYRGLCESGPDQDYMLEHCASQCVQYEDIGAHINVSAPNSEPCFDSVQNCEQLSQDDQCYLNPDYMLQSCSKTCWGCMEEG